jgi:hypothetical protein
MITGKYAIQTRMVVNGSVETSRTDGYRNLDEARMDVRRMLREKPLASIVVFNAKGVSKIYIKKDANGIIIMKEGRV